MVGFGSFGAKAGWQELEKGGDLGSCPEVAKMVEREIGWAKKSGKPGSFQSQASTAKLGFLPSPKKDESIVLNSSIGSCSEQQEGQSNWTESLRIKVNYLEELPGGTGQRRWLKCFFWMGALRDAAEGKDAPLQGGGGTEVALETPDVGDRNDPLWRRTSFGRCGCLASLFLPANSIPAIPSLCVPRSPAHGFLGQGS